MADIIAADDREKSLFLTQIKFLDEQLERCQLQCDELKRKNKDLCAQYSTLEKDSKDISEYLKLLVAEREKEVEEVQQRLELQQQVEEQVREALRLQHGQEVQQLQEQIDELQEHSRRTETSEEQQEVQEQQQEVQEQQEVLEQQEVQEQQELQEVRVQQEQQQEQQYAKARLLQDQGACDTFLNENVWNAVQQERAEHGELREKFQLLLEENEDLWMKKTELQIREQELLSDIAGATKSLHTAAEKNATYRKEEQQLTERRRRLQEKLRRSSAASGSLQAEGAELRERLASASQQRHQTAAEASQLRAELQQENSRRRRLEGVTQEGVITLSRILTGSQRASEAQWRRLLEVLEAPVPHRPDSAPDPGPHRLKTPSFSSDPLFLMARYRPGDLGLVPRPTWIQGASACRTGAPPTAAGVTPSDRETSMFLCPPAGSRRLPAPPAASNLCRTAQLAAGLHGNRCV